MSETKNEHGRMDMTGENDIMRQALEEIRIWTETSLDDLSEASGYAIGYKDGMATAQDMIAKILGKYKG